MKWQLSVTPPLRPWTTGWDFPDNYFPRRFTLKRDAKIRAAEALRKGGTNILLERVKS